MIEQVESKELYKKFFAKEKLCFLQSWEWGEVKKPNWKPMRLLANQIPIQIFIRKIPVINQSFGYIPRLLDKKNFTPEILKKLINFFKYEIKLSHLIIEPNLTKADNFEDLNSILNNLRFKKTGRTIQPNYTNIIDLTQSYEEIFANFRSTYRRNIRKAKKLGCKSAIFEKGNEPLSRFFRIMNAIMQRTKYVMHGKKYFEKVWNELSKSNQAKIYIISRKKEDLGALFVVFDNKGAYELYGGINEAGRRYRAGFLLRDVSIKDSKAMSKELYDQWGVAAFSEEGYSEKSELVGVSRFKAGFGGQDIEYFPQYIYVNHKPGYFVYRLGVFFNKMKIKFSKIIR
ncbi:peptidoglycan bridge formation glycyltransferase FemA/FemB family protein [Candidatus Dojkabacteria bacterium]|nr:peptidoglycan bridge formation glycyltransferase FemA/FemB family protein [Candidatus Dojkabacteria bacterium]